MAQLAICLTRQTVKNRKRLTRMKSAEGSLFGHPRWSMYGIFTYIWVIYRANVSKYSIHGSSGQTFPTIFKWNTDFPHRCTKVFQAHRLRTDKKTSRPETSLIPLQTLSPAHTELLSVDNFILYPWICRICNYKRYSEIFLVNPRTQADPNLTVDDGCVVLGDAGNIMTKRGQDRRFLHFGPRFENGRRVRVGCWKFDDPNK